MPPSSQDIAEHAGTCALVPVSIARHRLWVAAWHVRSSEAFGQAVDLVRGQVRAEDVFAVDLVAAEIAGVVLGIPRSVA